MIATLSNWISQVSTVGPFGTFENWAGTIAELGPLYPFVGSEMLLTIVGVVLWIAWHAWQLCFEMKKTSEDKKKLRRPRR